jgi:hypothetical protein
MRGEMRRSRSGILREGQYQRRVAVSQEKAAIVIFCCKQMEDGSGATIGMTVVGVRAGVIADTMTCIVVKKDVREYRSTSTRVQRCDEMDWLMIVEVQSPGVAP